MLIPNHSSTLRRERSQSSSLRPQVCRSCRFHRLSEKEKLRSCIPVVSSLLDNTFDWDHPIKTSDHGIVNAYSMEAEYRTCKIPEKPNALEPLSSECRPRYDCSSIPCMCMSSCRTEDIFIREDENGVRSHLCPLDKTRDGFRDENEDYPDEPMSLEFDTDLILKGCSLKSEDIPFLVAEKPPLSESEDENASSDVDASTSMIYAPIQYRQSISENASLKFFLQHRIEFPSSSKLDEKTMASWIEESSDDNDYHIIDERDAALIKNTYIVGDESDMEEFAETSENENDVKLNSCSADAEKDSSYRDTLKHDECSNSRREGKSDEIYPDKPSNKNNFQNMRLEENSQKESSELETTDENKFEKNGETKQNFETGNCPQPFDDQDQTDDALKAEVERAVLNAAIKLRASKENQKLCNSSMDNTEKSSVVGIEENIAAEASPLEDTKTMTVDKSTDNLSEYRYASKKETNTSKPEENEPNMPRVDSSKNAESKGKLVEFQAAQIIDINRNEGKKDNAAKHPSKTSIYEETQPDLATALRFMTEVYHIKDEEELYSDTLSITDLPSEESLRERSKVSVISSNYPAIHGEQSTDRSISITTPIQSSTFQPVLTEDQRIVKRPRNKFSKFIQSFKRKLAKKV